MQNETQKFYTKKEASEILRISQATLDRYVKRGLISAVKLGGKVLFPAESLNL